MRLLLPVAALVLMAPAAQAYIGPGVGAGAVAVVLGLVMSVAIAFVALLWYPFKRLLKKRRPRDPARTGS